MIPLKLAFSVPLYSTMLSILKLKKRKVSLHGSKRCLEKNWGVSHVVIHICIFVTCPYLKNFVRSLITLSSIRQNPLRGLYALSTMKYEVQYG
jgi:hypothetical protein